MEPHCRPEIAPDNCGLMSSLLTKNCVLEFTEQFEYRDNSIIVLLEATIIVIQILAYRDNSTSESESHSDIRDNSSCTYRECARLFLFHILPKEGSHVAPAGPALRLKLAPTRFGGSLALASLFTEEKKGYFHEFHQKRLQTMLWRNKARVNPHQRWKQTRFCICFHLWCELTSTMNVTEWQVSWNSWPNSHKTWHPSVIVFLQILLVGSHDTCLKSEGCRS